MSLSDWILVALAVLMLILVLYGGVFLLWLRRYGGPRGLQAEIKRRLAK